jgi:predicted dithiol-disulfide oxidoreductase (DUF899 family)
MIFERVWVVFFSRWVGGRERMLRKEREKTKTEGELNLLRRRLLLRRREGRDFHSYL